MKPNLLAGLAALTVMTCLGQAASSAVEEPAYPEGYRRWTHVLSGVSNANFNRYEGLHNIYANPKAVEGYKSSGAFPDGSVIVFDLFEVVDKGGATVATRRKFIDVMVKDSERYAATGGWGYTEFLGESRTERGFTQDKAPSCHACHLAKAGHDAVFTRFKD
ncbi:cytochrome P460 family protein [Phenylobacterium sp. LH3H17]|uniref:cytochrome P460 family protein n=1 Tax=Phenylobacterium sp. LH3H17 TaxID=2903901 RepID=UPI0020CA118E|nr:cytochrome P460 family protein [Phenylobacterium sp. LH3H17]UTP38918.1 cytochrome P460 family protein [Phenylobacterium sp. LH3H17]